MKDQYQIEECPVCRHFALLHGVCRWRGCASREGQRPPTSSCGQPHDRDEGGHQAPTGAPLGQSCSTVPVMQRMVVGAVPWRDRPR